MQHYVILHVLSSGENRSICLHLGMCQAYNIVFFLRFIFSLVSFTHLSGMSWWLLLLCCSIENRVCQMKKHLLSEGDTFIIRTSRFTSLFTSTTICQPQFWVCQQQNCVTEKSKRAEHEKLFFEISFYSCFSVSIFLNSRCFAYVWCFTISTCPCKHVQCSLKSENIPDIETQRTYFNELQYLWIMNSIFSWVILIF